MQKCSFFQFQASHFWHQKSINKSCFFKPRSWIIFFLFYLDLFKNGRLGDPFKIQWAPKWIPKSAKSHQKTTPGGHLLRSRKTLKHVDTPSGLNLRSFRVLRGFAFSNFNCTAVKEYMLFRFVAIAPITPRNT